MMNMDTKQSKASAVAEGLSKAWRIIEAFVTARVAEPGGLEALGAVTLLQRAVCAPPPMMVLDPGSEGVGLLAGAMKEIALRRTGEIPREAVKSSLRETIAGITGSREFIKGIVGGAAGGAAAGAVLGRPGLEEPMIAEGVWGRAVRLRDVRKGVVADATAEADTTIEACGGAVSLMDPAQSGRVIARFRYNVQDAEWKRLRGELRSLTGDEPDLVTADFSTIAELSGVPFTDTAWNGFHMPVNAVNCTVSVAGASVDFEAEAQAEEAAARDLKARAGLLRRASPPLVEEPRG